MARGSIETALRHAYARRAANDAAGTMDIFAPDATYRIAGHADFCIMAAAHRGPALRNAVDTACSLFRASSFEPRFVSIDDDHATVLVLGTFEFVPTGETITTELAHIWTFKDGKAVEMVEFLDTALAAHLHARVGSV